jgi:hypothetical protein
MLGAGVAVVDGNLEEPGAGHNNNRSAEIAGSAQPGSQRRIRRRSRKAMVAMVLVALSSRLQPGEHDLHYSHGGRESIHSGEFFVIMSDESLTAM